MYFILLIIMIAIAVAYIFVNYRTKNYLLAFSSLYIIFFEAETIFGRLSWNDLPRSSLILIPALIYIEMIVTDSLFKDR